MSICPDKISHIKYAKTPVE